MNVRIKTTDYQMTAAAKKYLDTRVRALEKLLGPDATIAQCDVELGRAAGRPRHGEHLYFAEFVIRAPRRKPVTAKNNEPTINAAIDKAKEEAMQQLRKQKTVRQSKEKRDGARMKRDIRME